MLKAVIFDMDGVIIDSEPIHHRATVDMCKDLGIDLKLDEFKEFTGKTQSEKWTKLKSKYNLEKSISELVKIQIKYNYKFLKTENVSPINGIEELLKNLKKHNIKTAVASSSPLEYINIILKMFNIKKYFEIVESGEDVDKGKPYPDIFLKTADMLSVSTGSCIVIEDSEYGVEAAKRAGMGCIGFNNPGTPEQNLKKADIIVKDIKDIDLNLLKTVTT